MFHMGQTKLVIKTRERGVSRELACACRWSTERLILGTNLRNLSPTHAAGTESLSVVLARLLAQEHAAYMAAINPIEISTALTVLAIGMLALVAIRWMRKPKQRAEKGKKARS
jgi:hypothetical protein